MLNVSEIAAPVEFGEDGRVAFEVLPAQMYQPALADMKAAAPQAGQLSTALQRSILPVRDLLTDENIATALTPKSEIMAGDDAVQIAQALITRATLLEAARLWFTEKLHQAVNHAPMSLRILKNDNYRL